MTTLLPPGHMALLAGHPHPLPRGGFWGLQGKEEQDQAAGLTRSLPPTGHFFVFEGLCRWTLPPRGLS